MSKNAIDRLKMQLQNDFQRMAFDEKLAAAKKAVSVLQESLGGDQILRSNGSLSFEEKAALAIELAGVLGQMLEDIQIEAQTVGIRQVDFLNN